MEIADGDGFRAQALQAFGLLLDISLQNLRLDAPVGQGALLDFEPHLTGDDGLRPDELRVEQAPGDEALRPPDLQNVTEAARRQNRGARPGAFEYRVGADGGAVRDPPDGGEVETLHSFEKDGVLSPAKRGDFGDHNPLLALVVENEVGEGSSGVYSDETQCTGRPLKITRIKSYSWLFFQKVQRRSYMGQ